MTIRQIFEQTDFKTGVVDADYNAQVASLLYQHGVRALENFEVRLEGSLTRRPGMSILKSLTGNYQLHADDVRLISCQWGKTTGAIIVIKPAYPANPNATAEAGRIDIYDQQGNSLAFAIHAWSASTVKDIKVADTTLGTLLCHETINPFIISYAANNTPKFSINAFAFDKDSDGVWLMPFETFPEGGYMSCSAASTTVGGSINIKTTRDYFIGTGALADHVGSQIKVFGGVVQISNVTDKRNATARVIKTLSNFTNATTNGDFTEQVFSIARGYPRCGITYQGRLIFGGSKYFPSRVWLSRLGLATNFDLGSAANGDGISFNITADQAEEIQWLAAGRYLEIYTNLAEWSCPVDSLSPTSLSLVRQGRYGMNNLASAPPLNVEGCTLFLGRDQKTLHQLQWSDLNKAYNHFILNEQAKTLTADIKALYYDAQKKLLYGLKKDGSLAVMTYYQEQQIFAWGKIITTGNIIGFANGRNMATDDKTAVLDQIYLLVKRGTGLFVETFNSNYLIDGASEKSAVSDRATPITLNDFLVNQPIAFYQAGVLKKIATFTTANFTLPPELETGKAFTVGLIFTSIIKPLNRFSGPGGWGSFSALKLTRLSFLVKNTALLCWQASDGKVFDRPLHNYLLNTQTNALLLDNTHVNPADCATPYNGWASFTLAGWRQEVTESLWQIRYQNPYPLTLLSVKEEYVIATLGNPATPPTN